MANPYLSNSLHAIRSGFVMTAALAATAVRFRWATLRLVLAGGLVWVLVLDNPARLTRLQLALMPGYNYTAEAERLRSEQRYAEALTVVDTGMDDADGAERRDILTLRRQIAAERRSVLRRLKEAGKGALTGRGESAEALLGAVGTDFFILGDIRDLAIEGTKQVVDGESDKLILGLSTVGVATSAWSAAGGTGIAAEAGVNILKIARKTGSLSRKMVDKLMVLVRSARRTKNADGLAKVAVNTGRLAKYGGPSFALHTLKYVDSPADLAKLTKQLGKRGDLAFAVHVTKGEGVTHLVKRGDRAADAVVAAAKHGDHGRAWLRAGNGRLFKPHPFLGLAKGLRKGTITNAAQRFTNESDRYGSYMIAGAFLWFCLEALCFVRRFMLALTRSSDRKAKGVGPSSDSEQTNTTVQGAAPRARSRQVNYIAPAGRPGNRRFLHNSPKILGVHAFSSFRTLDLAED